MVEQETQKNSTVINPNDPNEDKFAKLEAKIHKKESKDSDDYVQTLATREKLERDFVEDKIYITFNSSPETRRTVIARRPTQKEFLEILNLSIQAAKYEGRGDPESLEQLIKISNNLNKIAANLCVDKRLDEDFWQNRVSFSTLQNFIAEIINSSNKPSIGQVGEAELKSFR
jgi:hypothetical protein